MPVEQVRVSKAEAERALQEGDHEGWGQIGLKFDDGNFSRPGSAGRTVEAIEPGGASARAGVRPGMMLVGFSKLVDRERLWGGAVASAPRFDFALDGARAGVAAMTQAQIA